MSNNVLNNLSVEQIPESANNLE